MKLTVSSLFLGSEKYRDVFFNPADVAVLVMDA